MSLRFNFGWLALTAAVAGCNSQSGEPAKTRPSVALVSGKVVDAAGKGVANAYVYFHPKEGSSNEASGPTAEDGTFNLSTFGKEDGAVPGKYVVTIEPHPNVKAGRPNIPAAYASEKSSPFKVEVKKDGKNEMPPFELK